MYEFKCDLCDADYVGCTRRYLFQRSDEHKHSAIGNHLRNVHNQTNKDQRDQFAELILLDRKFLFFFSSEGKLACWKTLRDVDQDVKNALGSLGTTLYPEEET